MKIFTRSLCAVLFRPKDIQGRRVIESGLKGESSHHRSMFGFWNSTERIMLTDAEAYVNLCPTVLTPEQFSHRLDILRGRFDTIVDHEVAAVRKSKLPN